MRMFITFPVPIQCDAQINWKRTTPSRVHDRRAAHAAPNSNNDNRRINLFVYSDLGTQCGHISSHVSISLATFCGVCVVRAMRARETTTIIKTKNVCVCAASVCLKGKNAKFPAEWCRRSRRTLNLTEDVVYARCVCVCPSHAASAAEKGADNRRTVPTNTNDVLAHYALYFIGRLCRQVILFILCF